MAAEAALDGWKRAVRSASLVSMWGERQRSKMSFQMKKGLCEIGGRWAGDGRETRWDRRARFEAPPG